MGNYSDVKNVPEQATITITRVMEDDENHGAPDTTDDGFWPSLDPKAAGYIGENPAIPFEEQKAAAERRMAQWEDGVFSYQGVRAKARITVPIGGKSVCTYTLKSAGLWGIESDSDEAYLNEVYQDEAATLIEHIKQFANAAVTIEKE